MESVVTLYNILVRRKVVTNKMLLKDGRRISVIGNVWRVPAERANRMLSSHFPIALGGDRTQKRMLNLNCSSFNRLFIEPHDLGYRTRESYGVLMALGRWFGELHL